MEEHILQIDFVDSPGLGYEVFRLMEKNRLDKIDMEASHRGMVIKFRSSSPQQVSRLLHELAQVAGVTNLVLRDQMPYEEREQELRTILDAVSEGILAVNRDGRITHINEPACRLLHCSASEVVGHAAAELLADDPPILHTLRSGQPCRLKERRLLRHGKAVRFFVSCMPVKNEKGQTIGAVSTFKDLQQVERILSQVDKQRRFASFDDIIHQSAPMRSLIASARTVAKSSSTILLRGESGTGKELFAAAIHGEGGRYQGPFVAVNCSALPDALLESELFGYEEGSFTGALKGGKKGLFEQADKGTLFLDEIGELSPQMQVRLLRVLQSGAIRRVGAATETAVDVRIIAATHRNLERMIRDGQFREDLYYRLNVIPLHIPTLVERREDIPLLAQHLIRKICDKLDKQEVHLTRDSVELLIRQTWPGNVRQLENTLERLVNLVDAPEIRPEHLRLWLDMERSTPNEKNAQSIELRLPEAGPWPELKEIVAQVEREVLQQVLKTHPSSRLAGQVLGVSNTTILNKIKQYGL